MVFAISSFLHMSYTIQDPDIIQHIVQDSLSHGPECQVLPPACKGYQVHFADSLIMQGCLQDAGSGTAVGKQPSAPDAGTSLASIQGPQQLIAAQHGPVASTQQAHDLSPALSQPAAAVQFDQRRGDSLLKPSLADVSVTELQPSQRSPPLLQPHVQSNAAVQNLQPEVGLGMQSMTRRAGFASSSVLYQTPQVTQTAQSSQHVSSVTHQLLGQTVNHSESQHTQRSVHETSASNAAGVLHNAGQEQGTRAGQQQPYAVHAMQQSHKAEYIVTSSCSGHSESQTVRTSSNHSEFSFRSSVSTVPVFMPGNILSAKFLDFFHVMTKASVECRLHCTASLSNIVMHMSRSIQDHGIHDVLLHA